MHICYLIVSEELGVAQLGSQFRVSHKVAATVTARATVISKLNWDTISQLLSVVVGRIQFLGGCWSAQATGQRLPSIP